MKNVLIIGSTGQIGSELTMTLRKQIPDGNIVAGYISGAEPKGELLESGPAAIANVCDAQQLASVVDRYKIDTIYNLAALLSAVAEAKPLLAWDIQMNGLINILEIAREKKCAVFTPSSIGSFGPNTPRMNTPQDTIQRPRTMYGVTKVATELLSDYYFTKYGVDTRAVRFPGLISNVTLPGGGTTDYAVEIYYEALRNGQYTCSVPHNVYMDMIYMPDALRSIVELMEADPAKLKHRNSFNIASMSFTPEIIAAEIRKHIPEFTIDYAVGPVKEEISRSWPNKLDDTCAREEWGWNPDWDLAKMTEDMLRAVRAKLGK